MKMNVPVCFMSLLGYELLFTMYSIWVLSLLLEVRDSLVFVCSASSRTGFAHSGQAASNE